ncbi:collagen-like protein [Gramella sp. KN1008]|uniref:collagen-like protein n=1 Tax=Gramella sp. KN1008 TaxID=2529298 RepID=UPI001A94EC0C|nr:collagen-like protein [Gramella sp. KN1008]
MKKILSLLVLASIFLVSCEGDPGPPGADGLDGLDAPLPTIFEVESDLEYFSEGNLWSTGLINFSEFSDVEVFETDVVLIYRLNYVDELEDGSEIDEWSLLPQNFFTENGTIQYVYNHTFIDTEIFIDGNYDLIGLDNSYTQNQIFRVAIIPANFYSSANFNAENISDLMQSFSIQEQDIIHVNTLQ